MNTFRLFLLFSGLLLAAGCKPDSKKVDDTDPATTTAEPAPSATPALAFKQQRFMRQSPSCEEDGNRCARVEAAYPLAVTGPEAAVWKINDTLTEYLRVSLAVFAPSPEDIPETLDAVAQEFLDEYEAIMAEEGEAEASWSVELAGQVLYQSERLASIQLSTYSYAGGAHPNSFVYLLNFDAKSGEVLYLSNLVRDTARLKTLAEAAFRQARELGPDESLSDAGFFWDESFALPENYALTEDGLYFFYNPYEVAAYAVGPTEFTISREELAGLLKEY